MTIGLLLGFYLTYDKLAPVGRWLFAGAVLLAHKSNNYLFGTGFPNTYFKRPLIFHEDFRCRLTHPEFSMSKIHTFFAIFIQLSVAAALCTLLSGCQQKNAATPEKKQLLPNTNARKIANLKVINATVTTGLNRAKNAAPIFGGSDGSIIYQDKQQQWQAANTQGITETITRFCANDNDDVYLVVGNNGLLAASMNDGKNWKKFSSPAISENLFDCNYDKTTKQWNLSSEGGATFFSSDLNNWQKAEAPGALTRFYSLREGSLLVATGPELVAQSNDGGKHWQKMLSMPGATATSLLDTNTHLLVITDQGKLWRTDDLHQWTETIVQTNSSLAAITEDANHKTLSLITSLGDVFISDDQGASWGISFSAGQPLAQLTYDHSNKILLAAGNGGIFYSDNGGRVWQKSAMGFNDQITFLWATPTEAMAFGPGGLQAASMDGGKSWQLQRPAIASFIHQLREAPDNSLLLTGADGLLIRSIDGGETWQQPQATITSRDFLFSLLVTDKQQFATGSPGTIVRSKDNGKSWQTTLSLDDPNKGYFHKIIGDDKNIFIAVAGPGSTYVSIDAGDTWQPAQIDNSQQLLNGIFDKAHRQFIAIGNGGTIQRSSNGREWRAANSDTTADLQGIAVVGDTLYATGNRGTIIQSTDAGENWQTLASNTNTAIQHIIAVQNNKIILAAGLNGTLLRSTDKGDNWQTISLPETTNLREPIEDKRTGIIYISSRAGNILFSRDTGATWSKLPQVTQESIKGIYIDDARRTLVGYGARLIRIPLLER